ncbi:SDR family NAD(P)-dependent oxidoreductase [Labrys wisconsinensis]|uniref:NAD(P)-dependent dehydrogenase (Short-subunit alcohol dehydrogenase family) n=1 Tax=Labrys wisconsinensis TaxID=425677 RepID=A0ABU0JI78_9HYPH|nr:SDR family oxidoreductase [Labrys wisconsinensis]MDQ0473988.1 NAD(P)-dependent dehydrogenase (short-subunit alcohol dehydrogenase family) [Labrys wisconsinensis]
MPKDSDIWRKRALVTGAGGGLGRQIALDLAGRGVDVAATDLDAAGVEETLALCRSAGVALLPLAGDLTAPGAPTRTVAAVTEAWGGLDILVNNAGYGGIEAFLDMNEALWDRTLAINVKALALLTAAAGRTMAAQGGGRIVNITSPASRMALPNYAAYAASKAAVDSITRAAAVALAPSGVLVNSVAPGMMDTQMQRATEAVLARIEGRADVEVFLAERTRRVPLGRRAEIAEVSAAVLWLALDAPPYITAERLNASGGLDRD